MEQIITELNHYFSIGTVILQLIAAGLLVLFFLNKEEASKALVAKYALHAGFFLVLSASALTLLYSEVFGFVPCGLCWLQRVFLYPQIVILGIALWKNHTAIADYIIGLSGIGALVALYQHYLQMGGSELVTCPTVGEAADCADRILFEFGYITFPLMSFTVFVVLIILMLYIKGLERKIRI